MLKIIAGKFTGGYGWHVGYQWLVAYHALTHIDAWVKRGDSFHSCTHWQLVSTLSRKPINLSLRSDYRKFMRAVRHAVHVRDKFAARIGLGR